MAASFPNSRSNRSEKSFAITDLAMCLSGALSGFSDNPCAASGILERHPQAMALSLRGHRTQGFSHMTGTKKILVVEDDPDMRAGIVRLLSGVPGRVVDQAADAETARRLIAANAYDLAILDIELGTHPSARFAGAQLALDAPAAAVLFVSGITPSLREMASCLAKCDTVTKPFGEVEFFGKVERLLEAAPPVIPPSTGSRGNLPPGLSRDPNCSNRWKWNDNPLNLSQTQVSILELLVKEVGRVCTHADLERVLRSGRGTNAVANQILGLRGAFKAFDPEFKEIASAPGVGYVWRVSART